MVYRSVEHVVRHYLTFIGLLLFFVACQAGEGDHCQGAGVCEFGMSCQEGRCRSVASLSRQRVLKGVQAGRSGVVRTKVKTPCLAPFECPIKCPSGTIEQIDRQEDEGWVVGCHLPKKIWHGPFHRWFSNGNKRASGAYWEGKRGGKWSEWHRNGEKMSQGAYENDKRQGYWITWHPNGRRAAAGEYRYDKRSGVFEFWTEKTGAQRTVKFPIISKRY
jgi:hypothetical protein